MPDKILDENRVKQLNENVKKLYEADYSIDEIKQFAKNYTDQFGTISEPKNLIYAPSETDQEKQQRYANINASDAQDLSNQYIAKSNQPLAPQYVNGNFVGIDIDSRNKYIQSREGKAGKIISNYISNGDIKKDDLKYLNQIAPKATAQILGSVVPSVAKTGKVNEADINLFDSTYKNIIEGSVLKNTSDYYTGIKNESIKKLSDIGFDINKSNDENYLIQFRDSLESNKNNELTLLQQQFPQEQPEAQAAPGFVPAPIKRKNEKEYNSLLSNINDKYSNAFDAIGRVAASRIADPNKDPLAVGLEYLKYADKNTYLNREKIDKSYDDRTWADIGTQVQMGNGYDPNDIKKIKSNRDLLDERFPGKLIAETKHRLGAEFIKDDNMFLNFNKTIEEKDKAADQLPEKNREAYYKYIRPVEQMSEKVFGNNLYANISGTDIPRGGAINQLLSGIESTAASTIAGVGNLIGVRTQKDVIKDMLDSPYATKYQQVGEMPQAKARLDNLNKKLKSGSTLSVDELKEKQDLETYTDVKTPAQKLIDASFNLAGQVVFQAIATKGLGAGISMGAKSLGLLKTAELASGVGVIDTSIAGIGMESLYNIAGAAVAYSSSYDDANQQSLRLYPDNKNKQAIFTNVVAGLNALTERIFKDEKIFDAFKREISPSIKTLVEKLATGEIKQELLQSTLKSIIKDGLVIVGKSAVENTKETVEEVATSVGSSLTKFLLSPSSFNSSEAYDDAISTATTMFTDGALVALFAGVGEFRANKIGINTLSQLGINQTLTSDVKTVINQQLSSGVITQAQADEKLNVLKTISETNLVDMPKLDGIDNLTDNEAKKYSIALSFEKLLEQKIEATQDNALKSKYKDDIKKSQDLRKKILNNEVFVNDKFEVLTPEEASKKESENIILEMPSDETMAEEVKKGEVITKEYENQSDIPESLQKRISSVSEINGKQVIRVTIPKSLDNYLKQQENATTKSEEQKQEVSTTSNLSEYKGTQGEQTQETAKTDLGYSYIIGKEGAEVPVAALVNKKVRINGQPAILYQEGRRIVARVIGTNKILDTFGTVEEMMDASPKDFGIEVEDTVVFETPTGYRVDGEDMVNNNENKTDAISIDQNGKVMNVVLTTPSGARRKFRGQAAIDLAYQITLKEVLKDETEFEQFLESEHRAEILAARAEQTRLDDIEAKAAAERKAIADNERLSQEQKEKVKPAFGVFTKDNLNDLLKIKGNKLQKKVLNDVKNVVNAISKLVGASTGTTLNVHVHNQESFTEAVVAAGGTREDSTARGFYMDSDGAIHLNLDNIASDTMLHEGFHPILDFLEKKFPGTIEDFFTELESIPEAKGIIDQAKELYEGDVTQKKEAITDFVAGVADGRIILNTNNFQKIKAFILNLLNKIGIGDAKILMSVKNDQDLIKIAKVVTSSFKKGKEITPQKLGYFPEKTPTGAQPIAKSGQLQFMKTIYDKSKIEKSPALDKDEFKKAVIDKRISVVNPYESLDGKFFAITFPDDFFTGEIKYENETIAYGNGGVFFAAKFGDKGDLWAAAGQNSANNFVIQGNNSRVKNNGEGIILLSKGDDIKHSTSLEANIALINTIIKYADKNNQLAQAVKAIKTTYTVGGAKSANKIIESFNEYLKGGRGESGQRMIDAKNAFNTLSSSLIKDAGPLMTNMLRDMGFDGPTYFDKTKLKKGEYVATTQGIKAMYVDLLQEDFLKGLNNGTVYAALRFDSDIKYEEDKYHPSYPLVIKTVDGSPIRLEVFNKTFNSYGKQGVAIYGQERNNENAFGVATTTKPDFKLDKKFEDNPAQNNLSEALNNYESFKESKLQLQKVKPKTKLADDYIKSIEKAKSESPEKFWSVDRPFQKDDGTIDVEKLDQAVKEDRVIKTDAGFGVVDKSGDIKGVFKSDLTSSEKTGDKVIQEAVKSGGIKLDNFALPNLMKIYERNGFREVSRLPFNKEYAPEGWNESQGTPDVVAMIYDPNQKLDIKKKEFTDYDEAMSYRDSFIDKAKTQFQKVSNKEKIQRTDAASEKLKQLFNKGNIPLNISEAKEIVNEVIDWASWYDGISNYVNNIFGEYSEDVLSLLPLASQAANSATTVSLAISNAEKIYKGENPIGVAEYYGYVTDFLQGKGIRSDKMYNFFKAITGDENAVAVDMHVWSIIMGKDPNKKQVNPKNKAEFDRAKDFINIISSELGLTPREVQASLWAANILRTGKTPTSYEQYFEKQLKKGLSERIENWRKEGYKPFSEVRKAREIVRGKGEIPQFQKVAPKNFLRTGPQAMANNLKVGGEDISFVLDYINTPSSFLNNIQNANTSNKFFDFNRDVRSKISEYIQNELDFWKKELKKKSPLNKEGDISSVKLNLINKYQDRVDALTTALDIWENNAFSLSDISINNSPVNGRTQFQKAPIKWEKSKEGKGDPTISARNPIVLDAANKLKAGKITNEEYRATVSENSPITPITRFFEPATLSEINKALTTDKIDKVDNEVSEGSIVGLRLDIPAYKNNNTWVVSVHDGNKDNGNVLSYTNVAKINNVRFGVQPKGALGIATGVPKTTIGRMFGSWESIAGSNMQERGDNAKKIIEDIANNPDWVQVGMNPFRHSYFYDRSSQMGRPIKEAKEVVQVGGLVYAKNPIYGEWTDEAYKVNGLFDAAGKSVQFQKDVPTKKVEGIFGNKAERFRQKNFTVSGILGTAVKTLQEKMAGNISAEINKAERLADNTKKLIIKHKSSVTSGQISDYLTGIKSNKVMPQELATALDKMREHIDNLTEQLINLGVIDNQKTIDEYRKNKGSYMLRSYSLFNVPTTSSEALIGKTTAEINIDNVTDKLANVDQAVVDAALTYLTNEELPEIQEKNPTLTLSEQFKLAQEQARIRANEILHLEENKYSPKQAIVGSVNMSSIARRKEISPEIRALMGEYTDPLYNYYTTIYKIAGLTSSRQYLNNLKDIGYGKFLFDSKNKKEEHSVKIAANESQVHAPLNGLWALPEIAEALNESDKITRNIISQAAGRIRAFKTVYNPATHIVNIIGNMGFVVSNGHWNELPETYRMVSGYIAGSNSDKIIKLIDTLNREGILGSSVGINELKSYFNTNKSLDEMLQSRYNNANKQSIKEKIGTKLGQAGRAMEKAYQVEDDIFKILAFVNESNRYAKAIYGKKYMDLTESQRSDITEKASQIVKNTYPTWSRVPKFVKKLSQKFFLGNFLSFPVESIRNSYNTLELAMNEIKSGNKNLATIGITRLAGTISYNVIFAATNTFGLLAAKAGFGGLLGLFADDEEAKRKQRQIRLNVAPWNKDQSDLYISSFENGKLVYYDTGRMNSFKYQSDILSTFFSNLGNKEGFFKSAYRTLAKSLDPIFDVDMTYDIIQEMLSNEKIGGSKIYNPEKGGTDFGKSVNMAISYGDYMAKKLTPGVVSALYKIGSYYKEDAAKAGNEAISMVWARRYEVDLADQLYFNIKSKPIPFSDSKVGYSDRLEDAKKIYNKYDKSKSEAEKESDYKDAIKAYKDVINDVREQYRSAIAGGSDPSLLINKLKMSKIGGSSSRAVIMQIINSSNPPDNMLIRR